VGSHLKEDILRRLEHPCPNGPPLSPSSIPDNVDLIDLPNRPLRRSVTSSHTLGSKLWLTPITLPAASARLRSSWQCVTLWQSGFSIRGVNASFNNLAASFEVNIGGVRTDNVQLFARQHFAESQRRRSLSQRTVPLDHGSSQIARTSTWGIKRSAEK